MSSVEAREGRRFPVRDERRSGFVNTTVVIGMAVAVSTAFAVYSGRLSDFFIGAGGSLSASGILIAARIASRRGRRKPAPPDEDNKPPDEDAGIGG